METKSTVGLKQKTEPVSIRLTGDQKERLEKIGRGSISEGVRIALQFYKEPSKDSQAEEIASLRDQIEKAKNSGLSYSKDELKALDDILKEAEDAVKARKLKEIKSLAFKLKIAT